MRQQFIDYADQYCWANSVAVTAHLRPQFCHIPEHKKFDLRLQAEQTNSQFFARLDRFLFGNAAKAKRGGKRSVRLVVIENGQYRMHCHFLIRMPEHISFSQMQKYCNKSWFAAKYAARDIQIELCRESTVRGGFGEYITKQMTKLDADCIDFGNTTLSASLT